jgi:putative addiction module killer protein
LHANARQVVIYSDQNGKAPYWHWVHSLDKVERGRVQIRIRKISLGNFGDHHGVGDGVSELRFHFGSGLRVYYGERGRTVVILTGGDKDTQAKDIDRAKEYWRDYNARTK